MGGNPLIYTDMYGLFGSNGLGFFNDWAENWSRTRPPISDKTVDALRNVDYDDLGKKAACVTVCALVGELEGKALECAIDKQSHSCLLYTSPSPRDKRQSRMPSSA